MIAEAQEDDVSSGTSAGLPQPDGGVIYVDDWNVYFVDRKGADRTPLELKEGTLGGVTDGVVPITEGGFYASSSAGIIRFGPDGKRRWTTRVGEPGQEFSNQVEAGPKGTLLVLGARQRWQLDANGNIIQSTPTTKQIRKPYMNQAIYSDYIEGANGNAYWQPHRYGLPFISDRATLNNRIVARTRAGHPLWQIELNHDNFKLFAVDKAAVFSASAWEDPIHPSYGMRAPATLRSSASK